MELAEDYRDLIIRFIEVTKNEKMIWKRQNPSTYFFETVASNHDRAIVSIQKVRDSRGFSNFIFVVFNASKEETIVSINSLPSNIHYNLFKDLFITIENAYERKNMDFLKDIISGIES